jgi:hypothetical protein
MAQRAQSGLTLDYQFMHNVLLSVNPWLSLKETIPIYRQHFTLMPSIQPI